MNRKLLGFLLSLSLCLAQKPDTILSAESVQSDINVIAEATQNLASITEDVTARIQSAQELDSKLSEDFSQIQKLTDQAVNSPEVGQLLQKNHEEAKRVLNEKIPADTDFQQETLSKLRSQKILLSDQFSAPEVNASALDSEPTTELKKLLQNRDDLFITFEKKATTLADDLETYDTTLQSASSNATKLYDFTLSRLFWFKNERSLWDLYLASDFKKWKTNLERQFTENSAWQFAPRMNRALYQFLGTSLTGVFLFFISLFLIKKITAKEEFPPNFKLLLSVVKAVIPGFIIAQLSYYLGSEISPEVFARLAESLLSKVGYLLMVLLPVWALFKNEGAFANKLNLGEDLVRWIKHYTVLLTTLYFSLVAFPSSLQEIAHIGQNVLVTLKLIFTLSFAYFFCVKALNRHAALGKHLLARKALLRKNWSVIQAVIISLTLASFVLGVLGYHFAWNIILNATIQSCIAIVFIALLYPVFRRSILKVAMAREESWDSVIQKEHSEEEDPKKQQEELKKRFERTGVFVDTIFFVLILIAFCFIWNAGGTLGYALSQVTLFSWKSGESIITLSLQGIIVALTILFASSMIVKSLPSLFELFIFPRFNVEPGVSYAVISISRYLFFSLAILIAFSFLKVDLSKIGWLVAALGVGLGFGLQEIVSNFVCGLILLIERPVRVGDIITIDGVNGIVTKINIRSTTVTDWDRLENVIPNKNFITQKLTNWSLSSQLCRVVIPIGVAYGTDPQRVKNLLLAVAKSDSRVCTEPPPMALFRNHGASSLDFELRVYVDDLSHRIWVEDALVTEINRALTEEEIEIPFPQQDLHIRSGIDTAK